jgi:transcriptional regulator of acetoin/glycerol metabolism
MSEVQLLEEVLPYREARRRFQDDYWRRLLEGNQWNISNVARLSGVNRTDLHKKLNKLNIKAPQSRNGGHRGACGDLADN